MYRKNRLLSVIGSLIAASLTLAQASPIDDLASPDQATRDRAAATLRETFQPTPKSKWAPLLQKLQPGMTVVAAKEQLRSLDITDDALEGFYYFTKRYRLDEQWILECKYKENGFYLETVRLEHSPRPVWVSPDKDFTGRWTLYRVNGQKLREIDYQKGRISGEIISYDPIGQIISRVESTAEEGTIPNFDPDHPDAGVKAINALIFRPAGFEIVDSISNVYRELDAIIQTFDGLGPIILKYRVFPSETEAESQFKFASNTISAGGITFPNHIGDETQCVSFMGRPDLSVRQKNIIFSLSGNAKVPINRIEEMARLILGNEGAMAKLLFPPEAKDK